jgi:hypothetical protein
MAEDLLRSRVDLTVYGPFAFSEVARCGDPPILMDGRQLRFSSREKP